MWLKTVVLWSLTVLILSGCKSRNEYYLEATLIAHPVEKENPAPPSYVEFILRVGSLRAISNSVSFQVEVAKRLINSPNGERILKHYRIEGDDQTDQLLNKIAESYISGTDWNETSIKIGYRSQNPEIAKIILLEISNRILELNAVNMKEGYPFQLELKSEPRILEAPSFEPAKRLNNLDLLRL
jgi:hypothetical protein